MKKIEWAIALIFVSTVVVGQTKVISNPSTSIIEDDSIAYVDKFCVKISCSLDQKNQIVLIRNKYRVQIDKKEEHFKSAVENFQKAINSPVTKSSELNILFKGKETIKNELNELHFVSRMEIRDLLTLEQRKQISQISERSVESHKLMNFKKDGNKNSSSLY